MNFSYFKFRSSSDRFLYSLFTYLLPMMLFAGQFSAQAQERYPAKSITIVNPGPAGGAIDNPARAIAKGLSEILKESPDLADEIKIFKDIVKEVRNIFRQLENEMTP